MKREIKFRAWHKNIRQMHAVKMIDWSVGEMHNGGNVFSLKDIELMQFTGLLDKNGKEIYEGDIVKFQRKTTELVDHPKMVATTEQEAIYQGAIKWGEYGWKPFTYDGVDKDSFEVIGNRFENPELLNAKA